MTRLFARPMALRQLTYYAIVSGSRCPTHPDELSLAWHRYILFGLYLVGVNGGVRIWEFEKSVLPIGATHDTLVLTPDRWALEVYRTLMGTLQSDAGALLMLFVMALFAYLIIRAKKRAASRSTLGATSHVAAAHV